MNLFQKLKKFATKENPVKEANTASLESLENALIASGVSGDLAQKICKSLSLDKPLPDQVLNALHKKLSSAEIDWKVNSGDLLLFVGVNGSGKTTTVGKVGSMLLKRGLEVLFCGADSFRSGAGKQLTLWGEKLEVPCIVAEQGTDAGSVVYKTISNSGKKVVLIDTAGRQTTQAHLMDEIAKIWRIMLKLKKREQIKALLVLDALIGHSAVRQVEDFQKVIEIDGVIMNKLDTTAKGGTLLEIVEGFALPIYGLGVGEKAEDLCPFSSKEFARSICNL